MCHTVHSSTDAFWWGVILVNKKVGLEGNVCSLQRCHESAAPRNRQQASTLPYTSPWLHEASELHIWDHDGPGGWAVLGQGMQGDSLLPDKDLGLLCMGLGLLKRAFLKSNRHTRHLPAAVATAVRRGYGKKHR